MRSYLDMLRHVLKNGDLQQNRTGVATLSVFGYQWRHDLSEGFPLLTSKLIRTNSVVAELLWILSGSTSARELRDRYGVGIWDAWGRGEDGDLGPVYGKQWRAWGERTHECPNCETRTFDDGIDQIAELVKNIRATVADPTCSAGRRLIVSAWNVADLPAMALAPCHAFVQFSVRPARAGAHTWPTDAYRDGVYNDAPTNCEACGLGYSGVLPVRGCRAAPTARAELSCHLYQRSADIFLGVPFNIASYALLTHMLARVCDVGVGELVVSYGDLHLYENHLDQAREQLSRAQRALPTLRIAPPPPNVAETMDNFTPDRFTFVNYDPHPPIAAPVAV